MNPNNAASKSRFEALKRVISALFGINEVLFLAGFVSVFYGIAGIWSLEWAFTVCGFLLMAIAVGGIVFAHRKGE